MTYDVVVIGGGPGGYVAAIKCAQGNKNVLLIEERETLGGICLNEGCVPTKALLQSVKALKVVQNAAQMGIKLQGKVEADHVAMAKRSRAIVAELTEGLTTLMDINNIEVINGSAEITGEGKVEVSGKVAQPKEIIIASGTILKELPVEGAELPHVIYSREALALEDVPRELVVIGAGAIGIEFATIYKGLGAKVTVIEMMPNILPGFDQEMAAYLQEILKGEGINFQLGAKLNQITPEQVKFTDADGSEKEIDCNSVLVATGRKANTAFLKFGKDMIDQEGNIPTNEKLQTKFKNIWAVGDVNGKHNYAHVASTEGIVAAKNICGENAEIDYSAIPHVVYTDPELAWTGITENEAKEQSIDYETVLFPLSSNAKALCENYSQGLIKIIASKKHKEILGVHIIAPHAGELIGEAVMALKLEATAAELAEIIHAHPTISEIYAEAAHQFFGKGLHC